MRFLALFLIFAYAPPAQAEVPGALTSATCGLVISAVALEGGYQALGAVGIALTGISVLALAIDAQGPRFKPVTITFTGFPNDVSMRWNRSEIEFRDGLLTMGIPHVGTANYRTGNLLIDDPRLPGRYKMELDYRGGDRITISYREFRDTVNQFVRRPL